MARKTDKDRVREWSERISSANKVYEKWEEEYRCDELYRYYLGHQWKGQFAPGKEPYTINEFMATIQIQIPSLLFFHPQVNLKPRPSHLDADPQNAEARAQLREDTINTFIRNSKVGFKEETTLSLIESYFRFGVVEVGYTADFIDNPAAQKPPLDEENDETKQDGADPSKIVKHESLFVKRIPAKCFRVSIKAHPNLQKCDWYGYYEWHYPTDIKANPNYKNTTSLKSQGKVSNQYAPPTPDTDEDKERYRDMVKIWKIWDVRQKKRFVFQESGDKFLLEKDLDKLKDGTPILPHRVLSRIARFDEFYPLPVTFNWTSAQNELNDIREAQKIHRQRFKRKFEATSAIPEEELRKFEEPIDGAIIKVPQIGQIAAIQDAQLDPQIQMSLGNSKEDFREMSGTSGEERGVAQADTATQANIIDINSKIRETYGRSQIAEWLASIAELMLLILEKRMSLPFWIQTNVDPNSPSAPMDAIGVQKAWRQITVDDLGELETDVSIEMDSLSPVSDIAEKNSWIQLLGILTNPQYFPVLTSSDLILRKSLAYFGIRNEKEIQALKALGTQLMRMQMASAMQGMGGGAPQQGIAPGPTPDNADIASQISQQMPVQTPIL